MSAHEGPTAAGADASQVPPHARSKVSLGKWIAIIVLVGAAVVGGLWVRNGQLAAREASGAKSLRELGAILVPGTYGGVASVSLRRLDNVDKLTQAVALLPQLYRAESLDLEGTPLTDDHLREIGKCSSLISLTLANTPISDSALRYLTGLSRLQTLYVDRTAISDAALADIAKLKTVKILSLGKTKVKGDLNDISAMPDLEWVLLDDLEINDGMIKSLEAMPLLMHVSFLRATVSEEALSRLRAAHPGMGIDQ